MTHVYDGDHQRVATVDGAGAVTSFVWDGKNVLTDLDDTGAVAEYTLEPREFGSLISQRRDGETSQYHFDATGSMRALSDSSEVVTDDAEYSAFGRVIASSGSTENEFDWSAEVQLRRDPDTGDIHARRRVYNDLIARFLSEDPKAFESGDPNFYRYAGNNPVTHFDPSGTEDLIKNLPEQLRKKRQLEKELASEPLRENRTQTTPHPDKPPYSDETGRQLWQDWQTAKARFDDLERQFGRYADPQTWRNLPIEKRKQFWTAYDRVTDTFGKYLRDQDTAGRGEPGGRRFILTLNDCTDAKLASMSLEEKFVLAIAVAHERGMFSEEIDEVIIELLEPANLLKMAAFMSIFFGLGAAATAAAGTSGPPGWFVALVGGGLVAVTLGDLAAKTYELKLQLEGTTKCGEVIDAAKLTAEIFAQIGVDALLNIILFALGTGGSKAKGRLQEIRTRRRQRAAAAEEEAARRARSREPQFDENTSTEPPNASEAKPPTATEGDVAPKRIGVVDDIGTTVHKNSLDYVGDTHVYRVRGPEGTYKIGESAQGVRVRDSASIRGEQQARRLTRETGDFYESEIRRTFPDKRSAREYETRLIERFRRMFGDEALPGNKTNR